jgi:acetyl esterase/lipase
VFIHGGSWDSGSKDIYKFFAEGFTSQGYDVAVPNYRLFPEIIFPDMLHDTAKAVAYLSNLFSNRKVVLIGHSAGGYNALMVSMNQHYLKEQGISVCSLISGVVSISSPTGVYELKKEPLVTIFPDRFKYNDAPMAYVDNATPSLLVINGLADKVVGPQNAIILSEKVNKRGGQSVLKLYPDINHTQAVQVMSRYFDDNISLKSDILNFIDELPRDGNHCY